MGRTIKLATARGKPKLEAEVRAELNGLVLHDDPTHPELLTLAHERTGRAVCARLPKSRADKLLKDAAPMFDWTADEKDLAAQFKDRAKLGEFKKLCAASTASKSYIDRLPSAKAAKAEWDRDFEVRQQQAREQIAREEAEKAAEKQAAHERMLQRAREDDERRKLNRERDAAFHRRQDAWEKAYYAETRRLTDSGVSYTDALRQASDFATKQVPHAGEY